MAMYMAQELAPKIFYFTYCLQEPEKYINFIEDSENNPNIEKDLIGLWEEIVDNNKQVTYGSLKKVSSDFSNKNLPIDGRTLYIVNSLKATFLHIFGQYGIYNNISEEINMSSNFVIKKYNEKFSHKEISEGKFTAYLFINDDYEGGSVSFPNTKAFVKPEKASVLVFPSGSTVMLSPNLDGVRYVASATWI